MKKIAKLVSVTVLMLIFTMSMITISIADNSNINYKSTITTTWQGSELPDYIYKEYRHGNNFYVVLDNYDIYKYFGFSKKNKSFFKDNLLIVNYIYNGLCACNAYKNTGIAINNGVFNVSYTHTLKYPLSATVEYVVDFIELKKSDVNGVDLTKEVVNVKTVEIPSNPSDSQKPDKNTTIEMKYISTNGLIEKPTSSDNKTNSPTNKKPTTSKVKKPVKVAKVKLKSPKKKQLKVTWKKIKGVKYQVQYSLKKNMKNAKLKKNIKKNSLTLKKLKSNKKYYVRVRAYKEINGKTYIGKWSKVVSKTIK